MGILILEMSDYVGYSCVSVTRVINSDYLGCHINIHCCPVSPTERQFAKNRHSYVFPQRYSCNIADISPHFRGADNAFMNRSDSFYDSFYDSLYNRKVTYTTVAGKQFPFGGRIIIFVNRMYVRKILYAY